MAEIRLIDANALKKDLSEFNYEMALRIVDIQPTIEPEVRYERWVQRRNGEYYCTKCGHKEKFIFQKNFCPNCGARMDLRTPTEVELDIADSVMMGGADNGG